MYDTPTHIPKTEQMKYYLAHAPEISFVCYGVKWTMADQDQTEKHQKQQL